MQKEFLQLGNIIALPVQLIVYFLPISVFSQVYYFTFPVTKVGLHSPSFELEVVELLLSFQILQH